MATSGRAGRVREAIHRIRGGPSGRFLGQSALYGVGRAVSQLANVLLLPVYLAYLTPAEYGILAIAQMVAPVLMALWTLGIESAVGRFYYEYEGAEREAIVGTAFTLVRAMSAVGLGLSLLLGPWLFPWLIRSAPYDPHIRIVVWTAFFSSFSVLPLLLMRMREEAHKFILATTASLVVTASATLYFLVGRDMGVVGVLWGGLVGSVVSAVGYVIYLRRYLRIALDWAYVRRSTAYVLPMIPELTLGSLVQAADRFLLDKWATPAVIGLYSLARQFGNLAQQVIQSLKTAYTPMGFRIWAQDGLHRRRNLRRISVWFMAASCLMVAGTMLFAWEVLDLLNRPEYFGAAALIPFAVFTGVILAFYYVVVMTFMLSDRVGPLLWVFLGYATALVVLGAVLIRFFGAWGAVFAGVAAMSVRAIAALVLGERRHPIGLPIQPMVLLALPVVLLMPISIGSWGGTSDAVRWLAKLTIYGTYAGLVIAGTIRWNRDDGLASAGGAPTNPRQIPLRAVTIEPDC